MSDALAAPLIAKKQTKKPKIASTISVPPAVNTPNDNPNNDPTFEVSEIDIPDQQIMDILTQIENENKDLTETPQPQMTYQDTSTINKNSIVNVSNVSNVATVQRRPLMPSMYFPHSNVNIHYHFHDKN